MVHSSPRSIPQSGDIILRQRDASRRCTLSTSEDAPQIECDTYEEAIAEADRFAQSQHVDVWKTDGGGAFTRIIEWRVVGSA